MLYNVLYYYDLDVSGTAGCKPNCPLGIIKFSLALIQFNSLSEEMEQCTFINILTNVNAPELAERLIFIGSPLASC